MRIFLAILFIASITTTAVYAKEVFKDKDMKDIRVVAIQDGRAVIQDKHGTREEVATDDHIGKGSGKVVGIEKTFITVETGTTRTRMPVAHGFERK
jgi:hypothetical protein